MQWGDSTLPPSYLDELVGQEPPASGDSGDSVPPHCPSVGGSTTQREKERKLGTQQRRGTRAAFLAVIEDYIFFITFFGEEDL